jgi:hypothetical protein
LREPALPDDRLLDLREPPVLLRDPPEALRDPPDDLREADVLFRAPVLFRDPLLLREPLDALLREPPADFREPPLDLRPPALLRVPLLLLRDPVERPLRELLALLRALPLRLELRPADDLRDPVPRDRPLPPDVLSSSIIVSSSPVSLSSMPAPASRSSSMPVMSPLSLSPRAMR